MKTVAALLLLLFGALLLLDGSNQVLPAIGWTLLVPGSLLLLPRFERIDVPGSSAPHLIVARAVWVVAGLVTGVFGAMFVAILVDQLRQGHGYQAVLFGFLAAVMFHGAGELALPAGRSFQLARRQRRGQATPERPEP